MGPWLQYLVLTSRNRAQKPGFGWGKLTIYSHNHGFTRIFTDLALDKRGFLKQQAIKNGLFYIQ